MSLLYTGKSAGLLLPCSRFRVRCYPGYAVNLTALNVSGRCRRQLARYFACCCSLLLFMLTLLLNLCRYLDYIEEKKDIGMIIRLYERCLVACASYPGTFLFFMHIFSYDLGSKSVSTTASNSAHAARIGLSAQFATAAKIMTVDVS